MGTTPERWGSTRSSPERQPATKPRNLRREEARNRRREKAWRRRRENAIPEPEHEISSDDRPVLRIYGRHSALKKLREVLASQLRTMSAESQKARKDQDDVSELSV